MKKFKLLFIFIFILFLSSCETGTGNHDEKKFNEEEFIDRILLDADLTELNGGVISEGIVLPKVDEETNTELNWISHNPDVMTNEGILYAQEKDIDISLNLSFTYDDKKYEKDLTFTVSSDSSSLFSRGYDLYVKDIPTKTTKDINFYTKEDYLKEFTISIEAVTPQIATSDGKIYQSLEDQTAEFIVTLVREGRTIKVYKREITVLKFTNVQLAEKIEEYAKEQAQLLKDGLVDNLPSTHPEFGGTITWSSLEYGFVTTNGEINLPVEYKDVVLNYTISVGTVNRINSITLKNVGGNTEEAFLTTWLEQALPKKLLGSTNHLTEPDENNERYLAYQTRQNSYGVLNCITGKMIDINRSLFIDPTDTTKPMVAKYYSGLAHKVVGQDVLNKKFYHGYKMPNEENILWIVVHESGMPTETQNAEFLAKLQWNNAYVKAGREASWNYQVDAYNIYQSFDDKVMCWHAGDGMSPGSGNSNGIGIEMCINQDGNYEGAMHNDAKLVAYLMNKYNLGMENVKRHFDFSGKECPSYMIRTGRWNEFLTLVNREYMAIKLLSDADVKWTISDESLFEKGGNGLYYNLPVKENTNVDVTLEVTKGSFHFQKTVTITLKPDNK